MQHIYYLDKRDRQDGYYIVHTGSCAKNQDNSLSQYLGVYNSCVLAVQEARRVYPNSKGCVYCCHCE